MPSHSHKIWRTFSYRLIQGCGHVCGSYASNVLVLDLYSLAATPANHSDFMSHHHTITCSRTSPEQRTAPGLAKTGLKSKDTDRTPPPIAATESRVVPPATRREHVDASPMLHPLAYDRLSIASFNGTAFPRINRSRPAHRPTSGCAVIHELDLVGSSEMDSCRGTGMPRHGRA